MSKKGTNLVQIRRKREDSLIKNIEKRYKVDFGVNGNMRLGTYLKNQGLPSLSKALSKVSSKRK